METRAIGQCHNRQRHHLLTSSEVELMETCNAGTGFSPPEQLLTSSEVELMETLTPLPIKNHIEDASDFLGSWINGNRGRSSQNLLLRTLLTSSEVELMETGETSTIGGCHRQLLTSSEVELMETPQFGVVGSFFSVASDFLGSWINGNVKGPSSWGLEEKRSFWLPRKLN